jgi:general secretion pathway protein A
MYHQYFGLDEAPFSIAVNPRYLFMSPRHRDALAHLLYGVGAGGGFILLTGEVGTGKTTINRCLLEQLPHDTDIAIILNPALNAMELLATVCDELGIEYDSEGHTLKSLTDSLHSFLLANYERGRKTVLMIDEAQHLDFDVLEQIRLLTNLETNSEKLLQIILIGQPELAQMLARPELRQLNQRITARYDLGPLTREETGAYIRHRLQVAGMASGTDLFPARVVSGIHRESRGIPRLINVLCDRMLLGAYGRNKSRVDMSMLRQATREVMGNTSANPVSPAWFWGLGSLLLLVVVAAWWGWQTLGPEAVGDRQETPAAAASEAPVEAASPAPRQPVETPMPAPVVVAENPTPVDRVLTQPAEQDTVAAAVADVPQWLMPPAGGMTLLWQLLSDRPQPVQACNGEVHSGLACVQGTASTWNELTLLNRPILLELVTPERFGAAAILLGIEGLSALLGSEQGAVLVDLAELGPLWSGAYRFFWQPPGGFEWPIALGDEGAVVSEVASMFARLDGQQQPLADSVFNAALQQRVRLFQRQQGLLDDGVVGMQTLLELNEALGIDLTADQALTRLGYVGAKIE